MLCLVTDLQDFEQHNSPLVAAILFLMYKNNTCLLYLIVGCAAKYSCTIQEPSKFRFHASLITSIMPELKCKIFLWKIPRGRTHSIPNFSRIHSAITPSKFVLVSSYCSS